MQSYWGCKFDQVWAITHQQCWLIQEVQEVMEYKQDVNPTLWCQQCPVKPADQWISDIELTVIVVAFGEVRGQVNIHCQPSVNQILLELCNNTLVLKYCITTGQECNNCFGWSSTLRGFTVGTQRWNHCWSNKILQEPVMVLPVFLKITGRDECL